MNCCIYYFCHVMSGPFVLKIVGCVSTVTNCLHGYDRTLTGSFWLISFHWKRSLLLNILLLNSEVPMTSSDRSYIRSVIWDVELFTRRCINNKYFMLLRKEFIILLVVYIHTEFFFRLGLRHKILRRLFMHKIIWIQIRSSIGFSVVGGNHSIWNYFIPLQKEFIILLVIYTTRNSYLPYDPHYSSLYIYKIRIDMFYHGFLLSAETSQYGFILENGIIPI